MIDGSQMLGLSLTSNTLQIGSVKEYGKKKIVRHLVKRQSWNENVSEAVPVVLLTDKPDVSRHPLNICIADIPWVSRSASISLGQELE